MKRLVIFVLAVSLLTTGFILLSKHSLSEARTMLLVDEDNKYCPVTGKEIGSKKYNTAFGGKRYWFASYDAVLEFKKDPAKYLEQYKNQMESATSANKTKDKKSTTL